MDDPVRVNAQATVDAIDAQVQELGQAREALIRLFGLGIRTPTPQKPPTVAPTAPVNPQTGLPLTMNTEAFTTPVKTLFGDHVTVNYPVNPDTLSPDKYDEKRLGVLTYLASYGVSRTYLVRNSQEIGPRAAKFVFQHPWFARKGSFLDLTEDGRLEAIKRGITKAVGEGAI